MEVELNARSKRHWEDSLDGETVETAQVKFKRLLGKDVFDAPDTDLHASTHPFQNSSARSSRLTLIFS